MYEGGSALATRLAEVEEICRSAQRVATGLDSEEQIALDHLSLELADLREHHRRGRPRESRRESALLDRITTNLAAVWMELERIAAARAAPRSSAISSKRRRQVK